MSNHSTNIKACERVLSKRFINAANRAATVVSKQLRSQLKQELRLKSSKYLNKSFKTYRAGKGRLSASINVRAYRYSYSDLAHKYKAKGNKSALAGRLSFKALGDSSGAKLVAKGTSRAYISLKELSPALAKEFEITYQDGRYILRKSKLSFAKAAEGKVNKAQLEQAFKQELLKA